MLRVAQKLKDSGRVDVVDINDNPMARARFSALVAAAAIERAVGLETIPHVTPRDTSIMGLQSQLLGAHAEGIRNVLAVTGDPPHVGDYPGSHGVYDVDAIGLTAVLARLNEGEDYVGKAIDAPTSFYIGVAVNPSAEDLDHEVERFRRKVENGSPLRDDPGPLRRRVFRPDTSTPSAASLRSRCSSASGRCGATSLPTGSQRGAGHRDPGRGADAVSPTPAPRPRRSGSRWRARWWRGRGAGGGDLRDPAFQGARGGARAARVSGVRCAWAGRRRLSRLPRQRNGVGPSRTSAVLYERLTLEAFQSGLSWLTILRKREGFQAGVRGLRPGGGRQRSAQADVERLMGDAAIVRNRAKIDAAIANARATVAVGASAACRSSSGRSRPTGGSSASTWGSPCDHRRVDCARQGPEGARLPVRRADDRICAHAGLRAS